MDDQQQKMVRQYISLIGKVSRCLDSRLWWATDFSSKNRFNNTLPGFIQKFMRAVEDTAEDNPPGVSGPAPWQIRLSFVKHLKKTGALAGVASLWFAASRDIILEFFKRRAGLVCHLFRLIFQKIYASFLLSAKFEKVFSDPRPVYVIKTFVYDHSFSSDGTYRDVFFGELPEFLQTTGERVVFFANILGDYKSCLQRIAHCPNAVIFPIDFFSGWSDILDTALVCWFYRPALKTPVYFLDYEISDLVNADLSGCSSRIQPYQYLHYGQTKNLLKKIAVKTFLLTFENNPWEKMCILALRQYAPQAKVLGYQHTVIPQASLNMFSSLEEEGIVPRPDCVLTVGLEPKRIIERYSGGSFLPVKSACALRYENLWKLDSLPRTKTGRILLALEGILEVYQIVNYVVRELDGNQQFKVVIRTHPVLPVSAFARKLTKKLSDLPFVEISQGYSVIDDIKRTDLVMYWGSTVALEALWMGKPVVHFDQQSLFSYDPLFACEHLKWTVNSNQKLNDVFQDIYGLCDESFCSQRQKALDYLKDYFYPVNRENLAPFLV